MIVYNGAFVIDNISEEILIENYFGGVVYALLEDLFRSGVYPIVYAYIDGRENFLLCPDCARGGCILF